MAYNSITGATNPLIGTIPSQTHMDHVQSNAIRSEVILSRLPDIYRTPERRPAFYLKWPETPPKIRPEKKEHRKMKPIMLDFGK